MLADPQVQFCLSAYASVAHRYWNEDWSEALNRQVYGSQASIEGQGSNFRLEPRWMVRPGSSEELFKGPLAQLKARLDHQKLFASRATSLEFLTQTLAQEAFRSPSPEGSSWHAFSLHESDLVSCCVYAESPDQVELSIQFHNLRLFLNGVVNAGSRLLVERASILEGATRATRALKATLETQDWAQELARSLHREIPKLVAVDVDLGRYESLRVVP